MDLDFVSVYKNAKRELGQYPVIWTSRLVNNIQLFWERLSEKVHATILKGIVGDFKCTVFQRNLKESYGRPLISVCECCRKVTKVGSTATVVRNSVLIIAHFTFRDCRVHFTLDKLSRNSCICNCARISIILAELWYGGLLWILPVWIASNYAAT